MSKLCPCCKKTLLNNSFHKNKNNESGLHSWCKNCRCEAEKSRLLNDSEYREHKNNLKRNSCKIPIMREKNKVSCSAYYYSNRYLLKLLKINGCAMCGYDECIEICQFHHVAEKKFKINLATISRKGFVAEMCKCILLCPNCHAKVHLKERGELSE